MMANCHNYGIICCREIKSKSLRFMSLLRARLDGISQALICLLSAIGRPMYVSLKTHITLKMETKPWHGFHYHRRLAASSSLILVRMQGISRANRPHTRHKGKTMKKSCYMTDLSINLQREWTNSTRSRINNSPCIAALVCVYDRACLIIIIMWKACVSHISQFYCNKLLQSYLADKNEIRKILDVCVWHKSDLGQFFLGKQSYAIVSSLRISQSHVWHRPEIDRRDLYWSFQ